MAGTKFFPTRIRDMILAALFAAIVAVLSQLSVPVPISPVPITGQVLGVFLAGGILGARLGSLSLLLYVLLGAIGLPLFAGARGGFTVLVGPTGGYIWGFIVGSYILGKIVDVLQNARMGAYARTALGMCGCLVAVYALGTIQLAIVLGISFSKALAIGVLPFVPLDVAKLVAATVLSVAVRQALVSAKILEKSCKDIRTPGPR
ncbi:MAG TPA: biotin transporter BioY [Firmicutes bacterium]|nr:biotin transporter BioY [Bacillota bacterium]